MPKKPQPESLVYPPEQAAPLIHPQLSPRTLEHWRRKGQGPAFVKVGRRIGYTRLAIEDWLARRTRSST
jgi:hypothetical protein